jgi:hypothetical protein
MTGYSAPGDTEQEYSTTNRTRAELLVNGVYPEKVRDHAAEVLEDVEPGFERYRYAAALTEFVYENVDGTDGESNKALYRPDYVLDHGVESDCEDQAVLLASLLKVRSFKTRLLGVVGEDWGNHLMVQVRFPENSVENLQGEAEDFYSVEIPGIRFQSDSSGGAWLLCDPVYSPVVGCVNEEFFEKKETGELVFSEGTRHDFLGWEEV